MDAIGGAGAGGGLVGAASVSGLGSLADAGGGGGGLVDGGLAGGLVTGAGAVLDEIATGGASVGDGVSVILVSSVSGRQASIFDSSALLILSYGAIFATGLVGNLLVILTLTRNQRGKVSLEAEDSEPVTARR